jgi:two-component system cell cycle sensor histidine kinase/response regulator CckA
VFWQIKGLLYSDGMNTPMPLNEPARMDALKSYAILDTPADAAFDDLVQLAARICDAPMAAVSLVDSDRQWFKARLGIGVPGTERKDSICAHGITQEREVFVVPDVRLDPRFANLPLVVNEPHIQFYTGVRLVNPQGYALGMLCVIDQKPRQLSTAQEETLQILARQVVAQLERHRLELQLQKARDELEQRVLSRTAELEVANGSLKRAERAATEWKNRYDLVVASSGLAVYDIDRVTGEVFWSSDAERVLGFSENARERGSSDWMELVHPHDRDKVTRCFQAAISNGMSFDVQYRLHHGMDHYRWIQDRGFVVPDAEGRCVRVLGMMQDITQRKLAEDTMREQSALLDQTQDAIMVRDLKNNVLYWNKTAERMYGWNTGEVLGKPVHELLLRGDLAHIPATQAIALKQGQWSGEVKAYTKSGKELTINSRWTVLRDGDGKPHAFLVAHTDLTENKLLEAKFFRAQRLESVGALASGIAHDLNNVFTPILMSAQLLGDNLDEPTRANMLGVLLTSAQRGADMVKQVLTFARGLESGHGLVQVKHLLGEIEAIMRDTFPRNIRVERNIASGLLLVRGDSTQLYQVLMNLCINARDAMPDGGAIRLEANNIELDGSTPEEKRGPHVCITVADNGTGMPPEVKQKVFEPFFTTKEVGKGTGLGLSTVMSLVKAHGGFVELESQVGVGTRFKIFLPAESVQAVEPALASNALPNGDGELLLVVDDESAIREMLKTALEAHGYSVLLADEGTEALALYAAHREKVALVITDIAMPILDGHATIRALRKMNPGVKVIAASGLLEPNELEQLSKSGAIVLAKPYSPDKLLNTVFTALHPAAASNSPAPT